MWKRRIDQLLLLRPPKVHFSVTRGFLLSAMELPPPMMIPIADGRGDHHRLVVVRWEAKRGRRVS